MGFYVDIDNRNKGIEKALLHYAEKVARRYSNRIEIQWVIALLLNGLMNSI